jgi:tRNA modification GTPase
MPFIDTIVALITGPPPSGVAWIRLSGPDAFDIAQNVFEPFPSFPVQREAIYGRFASGDDGLALPFFEGHSYTGEQTVELSMHGSRASIDAVLEACRAAGARDADPGEFTLRAFLNGRIDLTQAEAVRDSCEALTESQLRAASQLRDGALSRQIEQIRRLIAALLASVEASVDFSDEIGEFDRDSATIAIDQIRGLVDEQLATSQSGRILREGYRVAIVGPPNAGKSSLMNALLGSERSIVTDVPGTTRDFVEERLDLDGLVLILIDTAGLRDSDNEVEQIGIQRSRAIAAGADEVWYVYDAESGFDPAEVKSFPRVRLLANKWDLVDDQACHRESLAISALTGFGLQELLTAVRTSHQIDAPLLINSRHSALFLALRRTMDELKAAIDSEAPDDLLSVLLNQALFQLGEITGETASVDMIERIFQDFCIGK